MTDPCAKVRDQLAWFVGGDLGRDAAAAVARHLAQCLPCRREASSLQQAHKALAMAGAAAMQGEVAGADDAMFAAMRAEIAAATFDAPAGADAPRWPRARWLVAAALLFGFGWWLARDPASTSLLDRSPIPGSSFPPMGHGLEVAPWAGPRARLQPLGFDEEPGAEAADPRLGSGMMRRYRLRTLEDELLAPRAPRKD